MYRLAQEGVTNARRHARNATRIDVGVHAAARGDALIAPNVTLRLLEAFAGSAPAGPPPQPNEPLTEREEHVLATVARGLSNTKIAHELHISLSTVKTHISSVMTKIGARNRVEVAIWAHENHRQS